MIFRSDNEVVTYFRSTKHKVAPMVYRILRMRHESEVYQKHRFPNEPITLQEIADFLNTNRHSVSRALRLLKEMGVISYRRNKYGLLIEHVSDLL
jgi:predicted transcriptional regulator